MRISGISLPFSKTGSGADPHPRTSEKAGRGVRLPSPLQWDPILERGPISCTWDPESPDGTWILEPGP
jgi:hypothetical protein